MQFLLAFLLAAPVVVSVPPKVVTTLQPATSYVIQENGTILTCDTQYGVYIQPTQSKTIAFYYVEPPQIIKMDKTHKYVVACFMVK